VLLPLAVGQAVRHPGCWQSLDVSVELSTHGWLPEEEAAQLRFAFDTEMTRLKAA
jgi:hypothetical protein